MKRSAVIIEAVARKHRIKVSDILGRDKYAYICAARRDAIRQMVAIGMTHENIARAMCRQRTTIHEYASEQRASYKSNWRRKWRLARSQSQGRDDVHSQT